MEALDPALRVLLAEWLAYHMSNYEFMWPWEKWEQVLTAPPQDSQRCEVLRLYSNFRKQHSFENICIIHHLFPIFVFHSVST